MLKINALYAYNDSVDYKPETKMTEELEIAKADSMHLLNMPSSSAAFDSLRCGDYVDGLRWYVFSHKPGRSMFSIPFLVNSRKEVYHQTGEEGGLSFFSKGLRVANLKTPSMQGWSTESILDWVRDTRKFGVAELKDFHQGVRRVIKRQVYTQREEDYEILALYVVASFFYPLFKAFAFLHIGGGFGSGKSHCSGTLLRLGFNSYCNGQIAAYGKISPPALCRLIDMNAGMVTLDDLEVISSSSPSPLRQALLVSYKKSTATQSLVANKKGAPQQYALYSPKLFTSIGLPDPVLGSRCLKISLPKAPASWASGHVTEDELEAITNLGYQLSMSQQLIDEIKEKAEENVPGGRLGEISQGLRIIAEMIGGNSLKLLDSFLESSSPNQTQMLNSFEGLLNAVKSIIREGYLSVSMVHLQAELRLSGIDLTPTAIGKLCASAALFRKDNRVIIHGLKTTDMVPSKRAIGMAKVSESGLIRPARSFCPQSDNKKFVLAACVQCKYANVCELQRKWAAD
jgi:hypothetical protein